MDVRGFHQVGLLTPGVCVKNTKNNREVEKSYQKVFYGAKNVRNRFSILEILTAAPKNIVSLHMSFEIEQFEVESTVF